MRVPDLSRHDLRILGVLGLLRRTAHAPVGLGAVSGPARLAPRSGGYLPRGRSLRQGARPHRTRRLAAPPDDLGARRAAAAEKAEPRPQTAQHGRTQAARAAASPRLAIMAAVAGGFRNLCASVHSAGGSRQRPCGGPPEGRVEGVRAMPDVPSAPEIPAPKTASPLFAVDD